MLVSPAFAQAAGSPAGGLLNSMLIPMILVFGIMWFFLIRPQQKKVKEDEAMRNALRRGDKVLTQGGIIGKVTKVKDDGEVEVEIAPSVKVHVTKGAIAQVMSKTEPAAEG
jgi:preprotein translocase subunit YajC